MPILNYTTKIDEAKTVGEIQALLAQKGARSIRIDYDKGIPVAIEFETETPTMGCQSYNYAPNVEGVLRSLKKDPDVPSGFCNLDQARRVAWRIEKDWLLSQFAKMETMEVPLERLMLSYMVNNGVPLYEALVEQRAKMIRGDST